MNFLQRYGPWALITGASEGTGAEFAFYLADEGINCVLVARREGPLAKLAAQVRAKGVEAITSSVDLASPDAATQVIAAVGNRDIGLFIANAGADTNSSLFLDNDLANWEALINLNILTTVRLCHHYGASMRDRGRGGIILVGSGACYGGLYSIGVYCGVKGFLLNFGEGLWAEMRHHGVDVLNLVLGRTDTPAHRRITEAAGGAFDPAQMASASDVARVGLAQLPNGPTLNWGSASDQPGFAPNSPDARRAKIEMIEAMQKGEYLRKANA